MTPRAYAVVLACILTTIFAPQFAAQKSPTIPQVYVANPISHPVPTAIQGTAAISGSVNITNTSLPVNGSVAVNNLPLDSNGNVRTSAAPDTTQYQYQTIVALLDCTNSYGPDYCTYDPIKGVSVLIEQTLATLSSQGFELVSITQTAGSNDMCYTLRAPITAGRKRNNRF